jgi:hypothetical protein
MTQWANWGQSLALCTGRPRSVCVAIPVFDHIAVLNKTYFIPGLANFNPQEGHIIR